MARPLFPNDFKRELSRWLDRDFLVRLVPTMFFFFIWLEVFGKFAHVIENRPGVVLDDPLLAVLPTLDMNWAAFSLIYGGIAMGVIHLLQDRERFLLAFRAYIVMLTLRMVAMYLMPLDPPNGMIILQDPVVQHWGVFGGAGEAPLTRDLFFSGHTSTTFLLYLVAMNSRIRALFLFSTIAIGVCVIFQKVHYSIDVFSAPFFAYGAFRMVGLFTARRHPFEELPER